MVIRPGEVERRAGVVDLPVSFSLDRSQFRYDPYPVGVARNIFDPSMYANLIENWPPVELFEFKPKLGNKYSLSERNNAQQYYGFVRGNPLWRDFYQWVKTKAFVQSVLQTLANHRIDLGLAGQPVATTNLFSPPLVRTWANWRRRVRQRVGHAGVLRARFEFSMLPADGGCIKPHADHPAKLVTLILSMVRPGEWNPSWGGGTAVLRPKDMTANFNHLNRTMEFADVEVIGEYPYEPNQAVIFVKTFNSHHCVHPMTGHGSAALRQTLTINLERVIA